MDLYTLTKACLVVFWFVMGLIIGSFLNVCIYRIPEKKTIVTGRSHCMKCEHDLAARDLVPLFSWLYLRGRCRYCGAKIPSRYAKIELLTGMMFALIMWRYGWRVFLKNDIVTFEGAVLLTEYLLLLVLLSLAIVFMMIQKDTGHIGLKPAVAILVIGAMRMGTAFFFRSSFMSYIVGAILSTLVMALFLLFVYAISFIASRRNLLQELERHKQNYFPAEYTLLSLCFAAGFPSCVFILIAYPIYRSISFFLPDEKETTYARFSGVVIAFSLFLGLVLVPFWKLVE